MLHNGMSRCLSSSCPMRGACARTEWPELVAGNITWIPVTDFSSLIQEDDDRCNMFIEK